VSTLIIAKRLIARVIPGGGRSPEQGFAVSANEEVEHHWPGYVDALTTMTMMLIFVMMILAVAIFSMSENVSRSLVREDRSRGGIKIPTSEGSIETYTNDSHCRA